MEGVTGVTLWDQVTPGHAEYTRFRRLMTGDVNAAVRGAFEGGADEVSVTDGHWDGSNILVEELDARATLNTGAPSPLSMMQGIDTGVAGAMFVGYHARQGSQHAVLDHTWSASCVRNVWLNDVLAGEYTLNAALAGHYGVPILLATGDQTACSQISALLGSVTTVVVKQATGRFAADCQPPDVTQPMIEAAARQAVRRLSTKDVPVPYAPKPPLHLVVELQSSDMADRAGLLRGLSRDGLKLALDAPNMPEAYSAFRSIVQLAYPR